MSDEITKDMTDNLSDRDLLLGLTRDVRDIKQVCNDMNQRLLLVEQQTGRIAPIENTLKEIKHTLAAMQRDRYNDQRAHQELVERIEKLEAA